MMEADELCFPQFNTSCRRPKRSFSDTVFIYILLSIISMLTAFLNLLVIISISHFRKLHSPTNFLLLSLAFSDFFVGLVMLFQVILIDGCWLLGDLMCVLYNLIDFIVTSATIGNMMLISVDRYVAICDPLHYSTKVTVKLTTISISLCWFCSVLYNCIMMRDNLAHPGKYSSCVGDCVIGVPYVSGFVDLVLFFLCPITVIIVLSIRVFVVAVSQARAMHSHVGTVTLQGSVRVTAKKSELKAARTLGIVILAFLLCLFPYFCVTLTPEDTSVNASSAAWVICLFYFNSCLNPMIYAFFYPWFRKSVKIIVTFQILRPGSCDINLLQRDAVK